MQVHNICRSRVASFISTHYPPEYYKFVLFTRSVFKITTARVLSRFGNPLCTITTKRNWFHAPRVFLIKLHTHTHGRPYILCAENVSWSLWSSFISVIQTIAVYRSCSAVQPGDNDATRDLFALRISSINIYMYRTSNTQPLCAQASEEILRGTPPPPPRVLRGEIEHCCTPGPM